jgi:hypothetical protein
MWRRELVTKKKTRQRMRATSRTVMGVLGLAAVMAALCVPRANGFAFTAPVVVGAGLHAVRGQARMGRGAAQRPLHIAMSSSAAEDPAKRPVTKLRLVQHKAEAFWFYRYALAALALVRSSPRGRTARGN